MSSEKPSHELYLGWHVDKYRPLDKSKHLLMDFQKLCNHGVILAQSGAGKSTLVGRVVEDILVKTKARVVVVDANADFRKSHLVADAAAEVWKEDHQPVGDSFDREEFERIWYKQSKIHLKYPPGNDRVDGVDGVEWVEPYVAWNELPRPWQMEVLGLEMSRNPQEVAELYRVARRLEDDKAPAIPISPDTVEQELKLLASTSTARERLNESAALSLQTRFRQAAELHLWRQKADQANQANLLQCFEKHPKLLVLDVPSVRDHKSVMILVARLLEVLWELARKEWDEAIDNPADDRRAPTFLVIDEAHNFVPAEDPLEPLDLRISRSIQRIAAEGRKYGLFLLLATQRPPKLRRGLLSECENVCLMRLQSPSDHMLVKEIWGLSEGLVHDIKDFPPARGLLRGPWADGGEILFQGGRRRTKETGGNLPKDWILTR